MQSARRLVDSLTSTPMEAIGVASIHIKVVTGELFTISQSFYGASGPLTSRQDAQVQMSFLLTKMAAIGTDQGKTVNVTQIVYEWIED